MNKPFKAEIQRTPLHQMKRIDELHLAREAPKGANLIVRDSGRGSPLTDAELKASIYAKGIIQPLIWKQLEDRLYVVAGNRRLRLLREIFVDAPATMVSTQDVDDFGGDWREVAIDTNLSLPPHLVERYEIIVALAKDLKLQPADVQARFGMTPRQYNQVMALGKMSESVRTAWKNGEIDAKTAQTFTLEPDPKEQDRIFAAAKKSGYRGEINEYHVSSRIIPNNQRETGKLVAFVGLDVVRTAKLLKVEDMFSDNHAVTDVKALHKLAGDKLAEKCRQLVVDDGWAWTQVKDKVQDRYQYGTVIATGGKFTLEQKKKSGCFVDIGHNGELEVEYGKLKPSEARSVRAVERVAKKKAKAKKSGGAVLTNALAERLSQQLEKAISASMAATPDVAVAALIAAFASNGHVLNVEVAGEGRHKYGKSSSEKNFSQIFDGAIKATAESRVVMLAGVAAAALSIQIHNAEAKTPIDDAGLQALVAKMDGRFLNNAIAVGFDAKDYFDSVNLATCVSAVRTACGQGAAEQVAKMKKAAAAKFATDHVVKAGWLPKELRTVHYRGPLEQPTSAKAPKPLKSKAKKPKSLLSKKQQKAVRDQGIRAGKAAMAAK